MEVEPGSNQEGEDVSGDGEGSMAADSEDLKADGEAELGNGNGAADGGEDDETGGGEEEEEEEFIVEAILDKKRFGSKFKYLMKWKGYDESV